MIARRSMPTAVLIIVAALAAAQVPVRHEQLIYSILAFNGKDYSGTFTHADADALYVIADTQNILTVRNTFVYFWPITQEWKVDTSVLDVSLNGTLELSGRGLRQPRALKPVRCTYYNIRGEYEQNWQVATGSEADRVWHEYTKAMDDYYARLQEYSRAQEAYELVFNGFMDRIGRLRKQGQDVSSLIEAMRSVQPPKQPEAPSDYLVPPSQPAEAFLLSLPVGEYSIRFRADDGSVMEGSERTVVSFRKRRAEGVGLEVIPGDKWTRPVDSTTPSSILYVDGSADLYLRPFLEHEYNDRYYQKMLRNDARGNPNVMKWVRIQQVPNAGIRLTGPGIGERILQEEPFSVEQVEGASLGYRIVAYDPQGKHKGEEPSLRAFHVPIAKGQPVLRLTTLDKNGAALPGGERQIRVVGAAPAGFVTLILAFVPLAAMTAVLIVRARRREG